MNGTSIFIKKAQKANCKYDTLISVIIFLIAFLIFIPVSHAQNEKQRLDILNNRVPKDTLIIKEMLDLTYLLMKTDPGSTAIYLKEIRAEAEKLQYYSALYSYAEQLTDLSDILFNYNTSMADIESLLVKYENEFTKKQQIKLWTNLAKLTYKFGERSTALRILNNCLEKAEARDLRAHILVSRGNIYSNMASYRLAINDYLQAIKYIEPDNDYARLQVVYVNIGYINCAMENFREALENYGLAMQYAEKVGNKHDMETAYSNIGTVYRQLGKSEEAIRYYEKALAISMESNSYLVQAQNLMNLGNVYSDQNNLPKALKNYKLSLAISYSNKITYGILLNHYNIGFNYYKSKSYTHALQSVDSAYAYAEKLGLPNEKSKVYELYCSIYEDMGQPAKSLAFHKEFDFLRDSLFSVEKQVAVKELEKKYQTEIKEQENQSLIRLTSTQKSHLKTRLILNLLLTMAVVILAIALVLLFRFNRQRNLAYNVLVERIKAEDELRKAKPIGKGAPERIKETPENSKTPTQLMDEIDWYFMEKKAYLDPKLKLEDVSSNLNIPTREITILLKEYKNVNFASYVNQYRIERSKEMMNDIAYQNFKIEAIAIESGFGTRQSFYNAFEQQTGMKPSYYQKYSLKTIVLNKKMAMNK